jgi:hypothetical protein
MLVVGWAVWDVFRAHAGTMAISPLHFLRNYSFLGGHLDAAVGAFRDGSTPPIGTFLLGAASLSGFVVFHFFPCWLVVAQIAYRQGRKYVLRSPMGLYALSAVAAGIVVTFSAAIPGMSAYFFSNVAFFVALPAFVAMLTMGLARYGRDQRMLLSVGFLVVFVASAPEYLRHSFLDASRGVRHDNRFVSDLLLVREESPLNVVLAARREFREANPITGCTAKPFVFPAVSERPWVNVIDDANGSCIFAQYAYGLYGITPGDSRVKVPVRLLPDMSLAEP